ncbi:MAG TPA: TrkA family potassium uptake protein [Fimbriimonadaceae bacterium]|nr:TrkA family potassium uptake protein [Fimbriimonadaceae bacterium]HRJ96510.1 TrkA family potassium uptake protein [Fimbriimonadaceae bacterium]
MYLVLVGGGNVGLQLAKRLIARGHEVLLLEKDSRQAQRLSAVLGEESVYLGDGCEIRTQKDAGFGRADIVCAVTGEDEDNLVVCQMAKTVWNVERVLARVNDPSHEQIFREIGIDDTVSATAIIFSLLEQQISMDELIPVGALAKGNIEVVEAMLGPRSPVVGKRVRDIVLPPSTNLVWLLRDDHGYGVGGDTDLQSGDTLVALVPRERAQELRDLLCPAKVDVPRPQ